MKDLIWCLSICSKYIWDQINIFLSIAYTLNMLQHKTLGHFPTDCTFCPCGPLFLICHLLQNFFYNLKLSFLLSQFQHLIGDDLCIFSPSFFQIIFLLVGGLQYQVLSFSIWPFALSLVNTWS